MFAYRTSRRETSPVDDDLLPDPHGCVREAALESEIGLVLPAIFRVVADADFHGPLDEIVLEEPVGRGRIQADLQPTESVLRASRSVVLTPDRLLVRPGAP